jgi:hypothetical protein
MDWGPSLRTGSVCESGITMRLNQEMIGLNPVKSLRLNAIRPFFNELKNNTSIERFTIFNIDHILHMFDLACFMQNNTNIKYLDIHV